MMSCPKSILISEYLDKELHGADRAAFETHVQGCAVCSRELEDLRSLQKAFAQAEHHAAPYGFANRVLARAAEPAPSPYPLPSGERIKVRGWFVPFSIRFAEAMVLLVVITVGILAGRIMTNGRSIVSNPTNIASSLSLDMFDATPPGSLGNAYRAMMEVRNEK
jgi:anti-sigma factor RsiW